MGIETEDNADTTTILLSDTEKSFVASGGFQESSYGKYCNLSVSLTNAFVSFVRADSANTINNVKLSVYGK